MLLNYNSLYRRFANQTLNWLPMDTEELYKKNILEKYDELKQNGWINNPFTYSFNSKGFRCSEFTTEQSIMFLGCSITMGIGIPEHSRWSNLVSDTLKMKCVNLGIGGGSHDTAFRLCHGWIDKIKPNIVIFQKPPIIRLELVTKLQITNMGPWTNGDPFSKVWNDPFFKVWSFDDQNSKLNELKNSLAIEYICNQRNIKFLQIDESMWSSVAVDSARDLAHPGVQSNINVSAKVVSLI